MVHRSSSTRRIAALALAITALVAGSARAGPLNGGLAGGIPGDFSGGLGALGGDVRGALNGVGQDLDPEGLEQTARAVDALADAHLSRVQALVAAHPQALELDEHGAAAVRAEVMALDPSPQALAAAIKAGFSELRHSTLDPLGVSIVVLAPPEGLSDSQALRRIRKLDPAGRYDLDHVYAPSGVVRPSARACGAAQDDEVYCNSQRRHAEPAASVAVSKPVLSDAAGGVEGRAPPLLQAADFVQPVHPTPRIGVVDSGIALGHPALAGARITQMGFAPGSPSPAAHGTAVAFLLVGHAGGFRGASPGADIFAGDVYGTGPTGGSVDAIVHALAWLAKERVQAINISLVGPPNLTLEAVTRALVARGVLVVAPVGNDGPAAPAPYPASYPGVIAVTAADDRGRLLIEDGRATHLDFAAPGADLPAAAPGGGFVQVRGTSFAAPLVTGRLAGYVAEGDAPKAAVEALARQASRTGGEYGRGLVGVDLAEAVRAGCGEDSKKSPLPGMKPRTPVVGPGERP